VRVRVCVCRVAAARAPPQALKATPTALAAPSPPPPPPGGGAPRARRGDGLPDAGHDGARVQRLAPLALQALDQRVGRRAARHHRHKDPVLVVLCSSGHQQGVGHSNRRAHRPLSGCTACLPHLGPGSVPCTAAMARPPQGCFRRHTALIGSARLCCLCVPGKRPTPRAPHPAGGAREHAELLVLGVHRWHLWLDLWGRWATHTAHSK
jgi:hypothetical protein